MYRILKTTAALLLILVPTAAAMGQQNFRQRSSDGSSNRDPQADNSGRRRSNRGDPAAQQDTSGYNRPDSGNPDFSNRDSGSRDPSSGFGQPSLRSRDSAPRDPSSNGFGASAKPAGTPIQPMVAPKSSGAFSSKPLPADLAILTTRSIFSRDHRAVAVASTKPPAPIFRSDVAKLIFRGAMHDEENHHFVAFIEDSAGSRPPQWVSIGQLLTANGAQINDITLDYIVVEKSGAVRQIPVGDNLDAGTRLPSPPASASLGTSTSSTTANLGSPATGAGSPSAVTPAKAAAVPAVTASTAGTASDEDVAEMMRRRRVQELGQ